uniref:Putative pbp/gobp family n=1 Tax=Panstrongylus lignarius TaxID=156445 RepID=A0A224XWF9_9HEMI
MKLFTILAIICSLIAAIHCSVLRKWPPSMEIPLEKCSAENNIPTDLGQKIISHREEAKTKDEKCLLGCYMKERGFLVDHKIKWELLYDTHAAHITDESVREKVKEIFKKCEENFSYTGKDDCQIAYEAYKCA